MRLYTLPPLRGWLNKAAGILAVAFDPEGRLAVSGGIDAYLRIWNVASGKEIHTIKVGDWFSRHFPGFAGRDNGTTCVTFTPDGTRILSGHIQRGMSIHGPTCCFYSWDASSGKEVASFGGHKERVRGSAVSSNCLYVLSGSDDQTVRLHELDTGKPIRQFKGSANPVYSVAFSPDGQFAVAGRGAALPPVRSFTNLASDNAIPKPAEPLICMWCVNTGEVVCQASGHSGQVTSVSFSPDGHFLLSSGSDSHSRL